jgi:hypothetical protein
MIPARKALLLRNKANFVPFDLESEFTKKVCESLQATADLLVESMPEGSERELNQALTHLEDAALHVSAAQARYGKCRVVYLILEKGDLPTVKDTPSLAYILPSTERQEEQIVADLDFMNNGVSYYLAHSDQSKCHPAKEDALPPEFYLYGQGVTEREAATACQEALERLSNLKFRHSLVMVRTEMEIRKTSITRSMSDMFVATQCVAIVLSNEPIEHDPLPSRSHDWPRNRPT